MAATRREQLQGLAVNSQRPPAMLDIGAARAWRVGRAPAATLHMLQPACVVMYCIAMRCATSGGDQAKRVARRSRAPTSILWATEFSLHARAWPNNHPLYPAR